MKNKHFIRLSLEEMGISNYGEFRLALTKWKEPEIWQRNVTTLKNLVNDYIYNYTDLQLPGQYILIDPYKIFNIDEIEKYMCFFPKHSLIETNGFIYGYNDSFTYEFAPEDFFKWYFEFEGILQNNISYLYPARESEPYKVPEITYVSMESAVSIKNIASVSINGNFDEIIQNKNIFYIAFPWLYNARTDDYIEICDKYPAEFDYLAVTIEKLATASNFPNCDFQETYLKELKEALCNIQISYEKKKSQLYAKGIAAITGTALTCIPFVVPHFFGNFNPELFQSIVGGSTIAGSVKILNDFNDLKLSGKENPFWVIWKWKQKSNEYKSFTNIF